MTEGWGVAEMPRPLKDTHPADRRPPTVGSTLAAAMAGVARPVCRNGPQRGGSGHPRMARVLLVRRTTQIWPGAKATGWPSAPTYLVPPVAIGRDQVTA